MRTFTRATYATTILIGVIDKLRRETGDRLTPVEPCTQLDHDHRSHLNGQRQSICLNSARKDLIKRPGEQADLVSRQKDLGS